MKTETQTPAKSIMFVGPVIGAMLETAAADTRKEDKAFSSTLTTNVGGFTELRLQDQRTTLKIKMILPPVGKKVDYRSTVLHGAQIEVTNGKFDKINEPLKTALMNAGIQEDQIADMVESTTGYPLATLGDIGTKIAELLSKTEVTHVPADNLQKIADLAPNIIGKIRTIFAVKQQRLATVDQTEGTSVQKTGTDG